MNRTQAPAPLWIIRRSDHVVPLSIGPVVVTPTWRANTREAVGSRVSGDRIGRIRCLPRADDQGVAKPRLVKCSTRRGAMIRPSTPGVSRTKRRAALAMGSPFAPDNSLSCSIAAKASSVE